MTGNDAHMKATAVSEISPTAGFQRMDDAAVLSALQETQAIRKGHFRLTSGRHSDTYIQCARVLEQPRLTNQLAAEAVARLPKDAEIDIVIAPAIGGILFGFAVATALDKPFLFTERKEGVMTLRRSFIIPAGARILVAEDVVTTGGSVKEVCDLVAEAQATVQGVISLIDRGGTPVFDAPFFPLLRLETPSWAPGDCALCAAGAVIDAPGSRLSS
ncbi:MAG: orotate phosphoribosyltransferase [Coriobacteriia bacterium]|nr:orotate phosphoribosyltransferase [Coriobacteriia bacterium]